MSDKLLVQEIKNNAEVIQEQIAQAAVSSGRNAAAVKLITVTKTKPIEVVLAAAEAGLTLFGENYPEETVEKLEPVKAAFPQVEWHMIGHLQSRKAKLVAAHFDMMHSLDSTRLAEKLDKQLQAQHKKLPVLLEMNVSGESSKGGWNAWDEKQWDGLRPEIEQILALDGLIIQGLMTMPPLLPDPEAVRPFFVRLRQLRDWLAQSYPQANWQELSMGTSADYLVAVEEGATYVRIGTAIVGARNYC